MIATVLIGLAAPGCGWNLFSPDEPVGGCASPAPLLGERGRAPGYIVMYRDGTPAAPTTARLAAKYGFTARHVYEAAISGFAAELSDAALAGIRCEPEVRQVEYDQEIQIR